MDFSDQQSDALGELVNIGFGRAASALSIMVGQRVLLEAPFVRLCPLNDLQQMLSQLSNGEITSIHQVFSGHFGGIAMLLMDGQSTASLLELLSSGDGQLAVKDSLDLEALREIGNIVLNAFVGSFGSLLHVQISFAVPYLRQDTLSDMLTSIAIGDQELEYALLVRVNFRLVQGQAGGYIVIVMGLASLENFMQAMRAVGYLS